MAKTKLYTIYMVLYGASSGHMFKMATLAVTCIIRSVPRVRDLGKSATQFYKGRLTTALRSAEFV